MLGPGTKVLLVLLLCSSALLCGSVNAVSTADHREQDGSSKVEWSGLTNTSCTTWKYRRPTTGKCHCGVKYGGSLVLCSDHNKNFKVAVLHGYCITPAALDNQTLIVGTCQYNLLNYHTKINPFYFGLPQDPALVDSAMCGDYSRTGQLCGDCIPGHSPPVFTYYPQCVNCTDGTNNWGKYLAVSLLPQTAFFMTVLVLRLRATSPALNGFILYSQLITPPPVLRLSAILAYNFRRDHFSSDRALVQLMKALFTFHSVLNLDFFRFIYDPFCLHPNATQLQILALDYITAVSPLLVIGLTYALVKLHYHNCPPVVWIWRGQLQKCCSALTRSWNLQTSLIDAFATFLLLSYIKFLSVSFTLLFPAVILDMKEWRIRSPTYLYYAATTQYLGREHLPYALLAVMNLVTFTFLPVLLLCLYPCRCFQRCLNHCNLSFQALHIFMDTFQGSYKNGTNGTRDYRYFAGGNLVFMVAVFLSLVNQMLFLEAWTTVWVVLIFLVVFAVCRPFRVDKYNNLHVVWLSLALLFYVSTMPFTEQHTQAQNFLGIISCLITLSVPPLCMAYVCGCLAWLCFKCGKSSYVNLAERYRRERLQEAGGGDEEECLSPLLNDEDRDV